MHCSRCWVVFSWHIYGIHCHIKDMQRYAWWHMLFRRNIETTGNCILGSAVSSPIQHFLEQPCVSPIAHQCAYWIHIVQAVLHISKWFMTDYYLKILNCERNRGQRFCDTTSSYNMLLYVAICWCTASVQLGYNAFGSYLWYVHERLHYSTPLFPCWYMGAWHRAKRGSEAKRGDDVELGCNTRF